MVKKIITAACATVICFASGGCADISSSSEHESSSETTGSAPEESRAPDVSSREESPAESIAQGGLPTGEKLKAVNEIYKGGRYTLECTLTGTDIDGEIKIKRIVNGSEIYQLQSERLGEHGSVTLGDKSYDFDYVCGMYRETQGEPELNVISQIVKQNVPRTENHIDSKDYDVEQYTFTGDTYITVMDFFFDKKDSHLVKYVTTYSVEGQDDIVETREVTRLDTEVDESLFNAYFADQLVNFDSMSEQQKEGFCRGLIAGWGITSGEMHDMGIAADKLGEIGYDDLFRLIHTCGKTRDQQTDNSSEIDSSAAEESLSESEQDSSLPDSGNESSAEGKDSSEQS